MEHSVYVLVEVFLPMQLLKCELYIALNEQTMAMFKFRAVLKGFWLMPVHIEELNAGMAI